MVNNEDATDLAVDISIREGLRSKFLFFWRPTFEDLFQILKQAEGIEFSLSMYACAEMISTSEVKSGPISSHNEVSFNAELVVSEILDDYWASYLCFFNGFTKQSQQVLRNTLELTIQLLYLKQLQESGQITTDAWTNGDRGVEHVPDKIDAIRAKLNLVQPSLAARLSKTYNLLCTSTHSHKDRMTSIRMPRSMQTSDCPSIEPTEVLYTRGLFLSILDIELPLLRDFFNTPSTDHWKSDVVNKIDAMLVLLDKYRRVIKMFDNGYLIHRENIALSSNLQVLYSVKLNGEYQLLSPNIKTSEALTKELKDKLESRLFQDKR